MRESSFECPTCHERVDIWPGGWPFIYSQAFTHLSKCGVAPIECDQLAAEIADRIYGKAGGT